MTSILTGIIVIAGISALLALLLEVADSYIADYGERHISINNQKDIVVKGGNPLLSSLMESGIFIPSACGGKGTCSYCKVKVHEGGGQLLPTETPYLDKEDIKAGVRLSCQVKVKKDMKIEIPEELFLIREFRAQVSKIEQLSYDNKGITLKILPPKEGISFKPGQYIQLQVPPHGKVKTSEYRAYSVASSARDNSHIQLVITRIEGGTVSTYVHDQLQEGDEVVVRGPFGDFCLRESDRDILFIATGSGLAPVMSMLYQIKEEGIQRKTTLFYGDRKPRDLYFRDQLEQWQKEIQNFSYNLTLTRSTAEDRWEGETGRVTDLIKKLIPDNAPVDVYICGAPPMVESCEKLLEQKGISAENVFYDKFE